MAVRRRVTSKRQTPPDGAEVRPSKVSFAQPVTPAPDASMGLGSSQANAAEQPANSSHAARPSTAVIASKLPMPTVSNVPTAKRTPTAVKKEFVHSSLGAAPAITGGPAATMSRGALRHKFQRTRGLLNDPRVKNAGVKGVAGTDPIPTHIAEKIKSGEDEEYWLQYWAANNCSWGEASLSLQRSKETYDDVSMTHGWMNFDQLCDMYKNVDVAERQRSLSLQTSGQWHVPRGFEDIPAAMMFWAPKTLEQVVGLKKSDISSACLTASLSNDATGDIMATLGVQSFDPKGKGKGTGKSLVHPMVGLQNEEEVANDVGATNAQDAAAAKTAEEEAAAAKLAEDAEAALFAKEKKKADRDKALEKLKQTPRYQAQQWLNGVTRLISDVNDNANKSKKATKLPTGTNKTYHKKFQDQSTKLSSLEASIRALLGKPRELRKELTAAVDYVTQVKTDVKAFNLLYRGYYNE